jgi:hypothetical protein
MQPGASGKDGDAGAVPLQGHKGPGQQLHNVKDSLYTYKFAPGTGNRIVEKKSWLHIFT